MSEQFSTEDPKRNQPGKESDSSLWDEEKVDDFDDTAALLKAGVPPEWIDDFDPRFFPNTETFKPWEFDDQGDTEMLLKAGVPPEWVDDFGQGISIKDGKIVRHDDESSAVELGPQASDSSERTVPGSSEQSSVETDTDEHADHVQDESPKAP